MVEYLTQYKQLLKQFNSLKNELTNLNTLSTESLSKWKTANELVINLEKEEKELNASHDGLMSKNTKELRNIIILILCAICVGLNLLFLIKFKIAGLFFLPAFATLSGGIVYMISSILEIKEDVLEIFFKKSEDVSDLTKKIKEKQEELSNAKQICNGHLNDHNDYLAKILAANKELADIQQKIDQLKIDYATPIFDNQIEEDLLATETNGAESVKARKLKPQKNVDDK